MNTFLRFNPSLCSINIGDQIIVDSIIKQMDFLFSDSFCIDISSHQPLSWIYYNNVLRKKDLVFVLGSNLLRGKLNSVDRQWDINIFNAKKLGPAVLIGVGWRAYNETPNLYTKLVYKKILSDSYFHSVRDSYTEGMMRKMGFGNVINTGCATMWGFTNAFCKEISNKKAEKVVFTVTDYQKDPERDAQMVNILKKSYSKVYAWVQGMGDYDYINAITGHDDKIGFIKPSLVEFDLFLKDSEDVDYVGTRLHGGIRALQNKRRTLIIATDNRAKEMNKDFNLPILCRENIEKLYEIINGEISMDLHIPIDNIKKWKSQFLTLN